MPRIHRRRTLTGPRATAPREFAARAVPCVLLLACLPFVARGSSPADDVRRADRPRVFRLEYVLYNRDIAGSTGNRARVEGTFTRGLPNGRVRWNDVVIASAPGGNDPFPAGSPLPPMEGLSYHVEDLAGDSLFARFPAGDLGHLMKTLVWDGAMFDLVDAIRGRLETLDEGIPARVAAFEDFDVDMAGFAALRMKDLVVERAGVSTTNGKRCAVFLYRSLSNLVAGPGVSGRSLYFGDIRISLDDGVTERLTLTEDVVMQLGADGPRARTLDLQRVVRFTRSANVPEPAASAR